MRGSMKNNWKNKMMQFMQGRYGADQMGQMLSAVSMVFLIISLFSRNQAWFLLAVIGIVFVVLLILELVGVTNIFNRV